MRLSFFKVPVHNKFLYQPRYWDPQKEERERRNREIMREMGIDPETSGYTPNIKGQFRRKFDRPTEGVARQKRMANIRLAIILVALFAAAYFLLIF